MRALACAVAFVLFLAGCGSDDRTAMKLDWDLSQSHTMRDVDWPDPSIDATELRPIASVRIRFSGGRELHETGAIRRVAIDRESERVSDVSLFSKPATVDDAYSLALRWCKEWRLPTKTIDDWHAAGGKTFNMEAYDPKAKLGPNDPSVSVTVLYSFEDDRPVIMSLSFFWGADTAHGDSQ